MRYILLSFLLFIIIASCRKQDVRLIDGKILKCDVAEVSTVMDMNGTSYGTALKKTYYSSGMPKTLTAVISENFGGVDTVEYKITYKGNTAHIEAYSRGLEEPYVPKEPKTYSFDAVFDVRSGYVTEMGGVIFEYKDGRLIKCDDYPLEYDQKGNITRVKSLQGGVIYTYDYNKGGKNEFYITSGYQVNEHYNLAEALGWIPVQPNNLRLSHVIPWGLSSEGEEYIAGSFSFENHKYDNDGFLISYSANGQTIYNKWNCHAFSLPSKSR